MRKKYDEPQAFACVVECDIILVVASSNEVNTTPGSGDDDPNAIKRNNWNCSGGLWGNK